MKAKKFIRILFVFSILTTSVGCRTLGFNDPQKKADKQQEQKQKELIKQYKADIKRHYDMQTKETRKRMKENLRKAKKADRKNRDKKKKSKWKCPG